MESGEDALESNNPLVVVGAPEPEHNLPSEAIAVSSDINPETSEIDLVSGAATAPLADTILAAGATQSEPFNSAEFVSDELPVTPERDPIPFSVYVGLVACATVVCITLLFALSTGEDEDSISAGESGSSELNADPSSTDPLAPRTLQTDDIIDESAGSASTLSSETSSVEDGPVSATTSDETPATTTPATAATTPDTTTTEATTQPSTTATPTTTATTTRPTTTSTTSTTISTTTSTTSTTVGGAEALTATDLEVSTDQVRATYTLEAYSYCIDTWTYTIRDSAGASVDSGSGSVSQACQTSWTVTAPLPASVISGDTYTLSLSTVSKGGTPGQNSSQFVAP